MKRLSSVLIIAIALFACKVNRHVQKTVQKVDSTGFFKGDTTRVIITDSSGRNTLVKVKETSENKDYEKLTVIEEYPLNAMIGGGDTATLIIPDYKFKRTTIYEKDRGKVKTSTSVQKTDTARESVTDNSKGEYNGAFRVNKEDLNVEKEVKKTGFPWWTWPLVITVIGGGVLVYLKRKTIGNLWKRITG